MRFNGMNAAVQSAVQFAAPAVAGAVLISGTLRSTLWIDVATAAVGVAVLLCVSLPAPEKKQDALWPALRAGVGYAVRDRTVGRLLAVYGAFVFFCVPGGFLAGLHVSRVFGDSYEYLTATRTGRLCRNGGRRPFDGPLGRVCQEGTHAARRTGCLWNPVNPLGIFRPLRYLSGGSWRFTAWR